MRSSPLVRCLLPALVLALAIGACGDGPTGPAPPAPVSPPPAALPPPPPPVTVTVSGVVYQHTFEGRRPLPDVPLDVSPAGLSFSPNVTTDADGRYRAVVPVGRTIKANATDPRFSQPCRASIAATEDSVLDVHLVPNAILSASRLPPTLPVVQPTLTGLLFERTAGEVRPVTGAEVVLDYNDNGWVSDPGGRFVSDGAGRYFFCNVQIAEKDVPFVWVELSGYRRSIAAVRAPGTLDIELVRR